MKKRPLSPLTVIFSLMLTLMTLTSISVSHAKESAKVLTQWLPFELVKRHIMVDVKIKGVTVKAMLDTGASMSLIAKKTAKKVGLRRSKMKTTIVGVAGRQEVSLSRGVSVELPGLFKKKMNLMILPDSKWFDMIIGMDYLAHGVIQFDYVNKRLRLATPNAFVFDPASAIPLIKRHLHFFVTATIDNVPFDMLLDTGNSAKVVLPYDSVKDTPLYEQIRGKEAKSLGAVGITKHEFKVFANVSNHFKIGPYTLENVGYFVASPETPVKGELSILGYDILKHFVVTLDLINRKLYLSAPS
ncbi:MAG: clan AA aspartic protease (TIGR02281 family) [Phenylobacterium sp.]|jgi:clan AA aspartic protease (TIGR02281 family)